MFPFGPNEGLIFKHRTLFEEFVLVFLLFLIPRVCAAVQLRLIKETRFPATAFPLCRLVASSFKVSVPISALQSDRMKMLSRGR